MRLRYFRYQDSWRIQRSFQTFPTFYFTPFNQCFTSGICVGFAMFYYILIFFTVFYQFTYYFSDLPGNWSVSDLFPGELPLAQRLNRHFPALQKELQHFWATEAKASPEKNDGEGQIQGGSFPLILFGIFFLPRSFCWKAQMVFSEHILTVGLYVRVWQAWSRVFRRSTWKGLVLIQPVPWLNHAWPCTYRGDGLIIWGGVSKIWEPGCFIETFKITVFDCLFTFVARFWILYTYLDKTTITTVLGSRPTLS